MVLKYILIRDTLKGYSYYPPCNPAVRTGLLPPDRNRYMAWTEQEADRAERTTLGRSIWTAQHRDYI